MRQVLRFVLILVAATLAWNWSSFQRSGAARQQTERLITLRVQASAPSPPMSVTVSEGYAVQVQWGAADAYTRFALRPNVIDRHSASVRVAIESPEDGRALGEVMLTAGGDAKRAQTSPSFDVQVLQIEER